MPNNNTSLIAPAMHEGELRILDTDLAVRLGFSDPAQIRKLIKRHEGNLIQLGVISTVEITTGTKGGRPGTAYYLNRKQAIFITAKSETAEATDITIEIIERFDAYERGETKPSIAASKPMDHVTMLRKAIALHGSALAFNKRQGMDLTQARLKAVATVKEQMGIDLPDQLGWQAQPLSIQQRTVNATEIGRALGMKNTEVNQLLESQGYHAGLRDMKLRRVWKPTKKGMKFGRYEDKAKKHSEGTVQPWVWFESIVEELRPFAPTPARTA